MGYEELESREYKVMLDPGRFGGPDTLSSGAASMTECWRRSAGSS
jgi:hypothetical protein